MTIEDHISDEKMQYVINRETAKISVLSGKIDKYEYLTGDEISSSNQQQIIEQAKFTHSPLRKSFEKQAKEQVKVIKDLNISDKANELKQIENFFPKELINNLISNKLKKIVELQNSIELDKLDYKTYDFNKVNYPLYF